MAVCYISIGSNLGDRQKNISDAIGKIGGLQKTRVVKVSSVIPTLPVGGPAQGEFLNAAIEIRTGLSPRRLLLSLQKIEIELGRVRTVKNDPRTIDLDILFFDDKKINDKDLILPHPRIKERQFVLMPLRQIAPHVVEGLFDENNKKDSGIKQRGQKVQKKG